MQADIDFRSVAADLEAETGRPAEDWTEGDCIDFELYRLWRGFCADSAAKPVELVTLADIMDWRLASETVEPQPFSEILARPPVDPIARRAELDDLAKAWRRFERRPGGRCT